MAQGKNFPGKNFALRDSFSPEGNSYLRNLTIGKKLGKNAITRHLIDLEGSDFIFKEPKYPSMTY